VKKWSGGLLKSLKSVRESVDYPEKAITSPMPKTPPAIRDKGGTGEEGSFLEKINGLERTPA